MKSIPIFIGYDTKETIAYHTCVNSIIRHSTNPISIVPLSLNLLKGYNETHTDGSNQFIYSRFLLPHLMDYNGWAIFIDGDMIIRDDITELYNLQDNDYAVMVVKHDYKTKSNIKYLGSKNEDYPRKNWSSVVLWNCGHIKNKILTPEFIQKSNGSYLHRFSWLNDNDIGSLPFEWNWLPDEYGENNNAKLLHYTIGTPCFNEFNNTTQAAEWHKELELTTYCQQNTKI
jgi:lipopolysaccharide biosynthesis glycosyltransferase